MSIQAPLLIPLKHPQFAAENFKRISHLCEYGAQTVDKGVGHASRAPRVAGASRAEHASANNKQSTNHYTFGYRDEPYCRIVQQLGSLTWVT